VSGHESVRIEVLGLPTAAIAARNLFGPDDPQIVQTGRSEPDLEPLEVKAFRLEPAE